MDRNGTYLARYPDNGRFVGKKMPGEEYLKIGDIRDVDGGGTDRSLLGVAG